MSVRIQVHEKYEFGKGRYIQMEQEKRELFHTFESFRKLNFSSILPNLTHGEFAMLKAVSCCVDNGDESEIRISDIVKHLKIPAPAVSRTMNSLEERGFIVRTVNKKDRRNISVSLTEKGAARLAEAEQILEEFQESVFGNMGTENMNRLIRYFQKLQEVMAKEIEIRKYTKESENIKIRRGEEKP